MDQYLDRLSEKTEVDFLVACIEERLGMDITEWNDHPERKVEDVISVLRGDLE